MASSRKTRHQRLASLDRSYDFSVNKEVGIQLSERQEQLRKQRLGGTASAAPASSQSKQAGDTNNGTAINQRPLFTRSNRNNVDKSATESATRPGRARSTAATTVYRSENVDRSATASQAGGARSAASTTVYRSQKEREEQKALLRKVLASKAASKSTTARSTASTSAKTPLSADDRRAFLKRVVSQRKAADSLESPESDETRSSISTTATSNHGMDQKALLRQVLAKNRAGMQQSAVRIEKPTSSMNPTLNETSKSTLRSLRDKKREIERKNSSEKEEEQEDGQTQKKKRIGHADVSLSKGDRNMRLRVDTKSRDAVENDRLKRKSPSMGNTPGRKKRECREAASETLLPSGRVIQEFDSSIKDIEPASASFRCATINKTRDYDPNATEPDWSVPTKPIDDDEGFREFVQSLQKEAAGDHVELWRGFQSLFYDAPGISDAVPEQQGRTTFDEKTKESLATMNLYLKSYSSVECVADTQLVNDTQYHKEVDSNQKSNLHYRNRWSVLTEGDQDRRVSDASLTTKEYLEKARRRLANRKNATEKIPNPKSETTASLGQTRRDENGIKTEQDQPVKEWPTTTERNEPSKSSNPAQVRKLSQHDKRKSWLSMYQSRNQQHQDSDSDEDESDKENGKCPAWPETKNSVELVEKKLSPQREQKTSGRADRPMPWLVALQERKARLEKDRAAEVNSQNAMASDTKENEVEAIGVDSPEHGGGGSIFRTKSVDSHESMTIARQHSLLDDDTDVEDEVPDSPGADDLVSGGTRSTLTVEQRATALDQYETQSNIPSWTNVKLRSTSKANPTEEKKENEPRISHFSLRNNASTTLRGHTAKSECGVPWSRVKLRSAALTKDEADEVESTEREQILPFREMLRRVPSDARRSSTLASRDKDNDSGSKSSSDNLGASNMLPQHAMEKVSEEAIERDIDDVCLNVGDEIDLSDLPTELFEEAEQPLITKLRKGSTIPYGDIDSVIAGNSVLIVVRTKGASSKARVKWYVLRENVKSLALDMAENRADLSLRQDETKSLMFVNAEDCLNFANAFYLTKTVSTSTQGDDPSLTKRDGETDADESIRTVSKDETHNSTSSTASFDSNDSREKEASRVIHMPGSVHATSTMRLTDEEEKVLAKYRLMRKTNEPDEAIRQTIDSENKVEVADTMEVAPKSSNTDLDEEDEKVASRFRKMLKMMIPPEAVRHKMKMEQVSERIVMSVLGTVDQEKNLAMTKSDEQKQQDEDIGTDDTIADKYRRMLQMRVPKDAVRHKMERDQVSDEVISVVLGDGEAKVGSVACLSEDEERAAEIYRKMLKMMVPKEAVSHRMKKDKVDIKIVNAVMGEDSSDTSSSSQSLTFGEEKTASSYRKMLKMKVPREAVQHKMKKDNVDPKIMSAVLGEKTSKPSRPAPKAAFRLSPADEIIASRYRSMLKKMIPVEAVRHKMEKENVDPKVIAAVLDLEPKIKAPDDLSEEENRVASTYRKMLKLNVPKDAVRHKMLRDSVNERIVAAVVGDAASTPAASKTAPKGSKLVALHWTPLSGEDLDNSVWRASKKRKVNAETKDVDTLIELFQKKSNPRAGKGAGSSSSSGTGDGMAKLIDLNRANNVAISLKAFKEFSHKELAATIANLDPHKLIRGERCQFVKDLLPNPSEMKTIESYKGPTSKLVSAEIFFRHLLHVRRIQVKVNVIQTMDAFHENATDLSSQFGLLATVCRQVQTSEKLQDVLEIVLQVGNIMNEGTRTGGAAGFKFDSLLKLTQTKSADGKTTVLDYIVMILIAKNNRETLDLLSEFPEVQAAGRMALNDMTGDVRAMTGALNQCKSELVAIKKDLSPKPVTRSMTKKFGDTSDNHSSDNPRNAQLAAIKANGPIEEAPKLSETRDKFLAAARESQSKTTEHQKHGNVGDILNAITSCGQLDDVNDDEGDDGSPRSKMLASIKQKSLRKVKAEVNAAKEKKEAVNKSGSPEEGVKRLEFFLSEAAITMTKLEKDRDEAIEACKELSKYCGEGGGERSAISLLGILSQFSIYLSNAVKKYDENEQAKARKAAALKRKESLEVSGEKKGSNLSQSSPLPSRSKTKGGATSVNKNQGQSLVLMVNDMLHSASDQAKEDFVKGVVYEKTSDSRLRTIYERERKSLGGVLMAQNDGRESILNAIKKRRKPEEQESAESSTTTS